MPKQAKPKIRLYVPQAYAGGARVELNSNQSHYLAQVMRKGVGDSVGLFNGHDGEWLAEISSIDKKSVALLLKEKIAKHQSCPDIWLAFAPIKNKTELVVEKATELGAAKIIAVATRHAVVKTINQEKLIAHSIEAAEQCERYDVPAIEFHKDLNALLSAWPKDRTLLYGDESGSGTPIKELLALLPKGKYALLIGPEGGFAPEEHALLAAASFVKPFGMGPRILRADTAAVAALACLQAWLGDWEIKPHFTA